MKKEEYELQQCDKCKEAGSQIHCETLPASGRHCTFKGPTIGIMKRMLKGLPVISAPQDGADGDGDGDGENKPSEVEFSWDDCFTMICQLSVRPKFVEGESAGDDEALLDDLDMIDFTALVQAMTTAAGLTKAAMEANPT